MTATASNLFRGDQGVVKVQATSSASGVALGLMTNFEINVTADMLDASNFDSGRWKEGKPGFREWKITAETLMCSTAATSESDTLRGLFSSEARYWYHVENTSTTATAGYSWQGYGYVTNYSVGGDKDSLQFNNFEITGDADLVESST